MPPDDRRRGAGAPPRFGTRTERVGRADIPAHAPPARSASVGAVSPCREASQSATVVTTRVRTVPSRAGGDGRWLDAWCCGVVRTLIEHTRGRLVSPPWRDGVGWWAPERPTRAVVTAGVADSLDRGADRHASESQFGGQRMTDGRREIFRGEALLRYTENRNRAVLPNAIRSQIFRAVGCSERSYMWVPRPTWRRK